MDTSAYPRPTTVAPNPEASAIVTFTSGTPGLGPKCFRISNIPSTWDEQELLHHLKSVDSSLECLTTSATRLSLYPACSGFSKVALLNMMEIPEYFQSIPQNGYKLLPQPHSDLIIDNHFYDLTPLNTLKGDIIAESVILA